MGDGRIQEILSGPQNPGLIGYKLTCIHLEEKY
jgi:hypothetical protein